MGALIWYLASRTSLKMNSYNYDSYSATEQCKFCSSLLHYISWTLLLWVCRGSRFTPSMVRYLEPSVNPAINGFLDLKNATDDALAPYLTKLPSPYTFTPSYYHTNTRLALGYSAVLIAAVTFYADWKLGWDATKRYTLVACVVYFVLNSLLTYWIWRVERGRVFVGRRKGGQKVMELRPKWRFRVCKFR